MGAVCFSLPVYKDDACDEKSHSYGKEVRQRHVVIVRIQYAAPRGSIGEGGIVKAIDPAALLQCVVSVVPIIHHAVCKIALKTGGKMKTEFMKFEYQGEIGNTSHILPCSCYISAFRRFACSGYFL